MSSDTDRLRALQDEVNAILEERITDVLSSIQAFREVTTQLAAANLDLARQQTYASQLESELSNASTKLEVMQKTEALENARAHVGRIQKHRDDMFSTLTGLARELKGLPASA